MIIPILPLLNVEQCVVICSNNVIHITFAAWKVIFASSFIPSEFKPLFHCIPVLQIVTERGRVFIMLLYMELKVGILVSPCPSLRPSPHYSPCYSPHYGLDAENWECGNILRVISTLWLKCGYNAEISPYSCPNTPIRIFSAFSPHFFPYKNAEISPRSCPNTPIRIFSAFPPHFFPYKNAEISPRSCPNTLIHIFSARKMRRSGVRAPMLCMLWAHVQSFSYKFLPWMSLHILEI